MSKILILHIVQNLKLDSKPFDTKHLICQHSPKCDVCSAVKSSLKLSDINYYINAHEEVKNQKSLILNAAEYP